MPREGVISVSLIKITHVYYLGEPQLSEDMAAEGNHDIVCLCMGETQSGESSILWKSNQSAKTLIWPSHCLIKWGRVNMGLSGGAALSFVNFST